MDLFTTATTLENKALGLGVKVDNGVVTLVLTQVSVPDVTLPEDATEEQIVKAQAEAKVAAQIVADALAASTDEKTRTANVTAIENPGVALVIENAGIELTQNGDEETYTATFTYEFGVSDITVVTENGKYYVEATAELGEDFSFAEGVSVVISMLDEEGKVLKSATVTPTNEGCKARFELPTDLGTFQIKAKATNETVVHDSSDTGDTGGDENL